MQFRKQQLEVDMEQQTASKLGKEYVKAASCHPAYLTYMQSTSWETLGWVKGGVICTSEVFDIPPSNLDSSMCFIQPSVSHDVLRI